MNRSYKNACKNVMLFFFIKFLKGMYLFYDNKFFICSSPIYAPHKNLSRHFVERR